MTKEDFEKKSFAQLFDLFTKMEERIERLVKERDQLKKELGGKTTREAKKQLIQENNKLKARLAAIENILQQKSNK